MLEEILTFCVNLSRQLIVSGANLERVYLAVKFICKTYNLQDVSIFLLSSHISVSASDSDGHYAARQVSIPPAGIHLERLRTLNQLSYKVAEIKPNPKTLSQMLSRAMTVKEYSDSIIILGRIIAMSSLSFIFGGNFLDLLPVICVTVIIHYLLNYFERSGLDRIVMNILIMFIAASFAILFVYSGLGDNLAVILITVSMIVIPGIPLVNAMRNLLCGHENNGILQMLKIFIETMALMLGVYIALVVFKGFVMMRPIDASHVNNYLLIVLSYFASIGFAIVFQIPVKDLWLAGLGGGLTRIALILLAPFNFSRLLYMTLSALVAALYAEFFAFARHQPSTYFAYPSIIPLVPGDLFFYVITGLYLGNIEFVQVNALNCLYSLSGLSLGFVLSPTVAHYVRRIKLRQL
ncbi:MAG: threonine/serine exporter family protein [Synergistaceae bacterium]|nr:threonine/serine exporter family protein [Synergistaceae bacterium]